MASVLKETIPYVELTVEAVKLRNLGYDRFRFQFNRANRKLIDLVAWKYYERPDLRKLNSPVVNLYAIGKRLATSDIGDSNP